jgi:hypothetical protein
MNVIRCVRYALPKCLAWVHTYSALRWDRYCREPYGHVSGLFPITVATTPSPPQLWKPLGATSGELAERVPAPSNVACITVADWLLASAAKTRVKQGRDALLDGSLDADQHLV